MYTHTYIQLSLRGTGFLTWSARDHEESLSCTNSLIMLRLDLSRPETRSCPVRILGQRSYKDS